MYYARQCGQDQHFNHHLIIRNVCTGGRLGTHFWVYTVDSFRLSTVLNSCEEILRNLRSVRRHCVTKHCLANYKVFCLYFKQIRSQIAKKSWIFVCIAKNFCCNTSNMLCNCEEKRLYYNAFKVFVIQHSSSQGFLSDFQSLSNIVNLPSRCQCSWVILGIAVIFVPRSFSRHLFKL